MTDILNLISISIIPIIMTTILVHGLIKGVDIYEAFVEGAKEGVNTAIRIMPYLIGIFLAIGIFRTSGAMDFFIKITGFITDTFNIPKELTPLIIMRPISGSGALGVVKDIINTHGPDSFIGRVASTMMGSAETIFYTMAVYFGAIGIKKSRHTMWAALISHVAAVMASLWVCEIVFK
ncbi:MAG: spore maturation protein [Anaeromicrobium sp.]|jgi:spore maturation protein B|uniref:spore maturation protein n=1 Tax=Anaeromicrobium sp. TaxID=1929132 RepID=UPI0025FCA96F|nr:nucleoside recognition domain-containing protein [Anaeromicrobium sp.]MCT4593649.1 spore maturation protein [Anaeromicrobium sp.]